MEIKHLFDVRSLFLNKIFTKLKYIDKLQKSIYVNSSILSEIIYIKDKLCNMLLNESDLSKVSDGNLYSLGSDVGKNLLNSLNGMVVLVSSHTYTDGANRFIQDDSIRRYILPLTYNGCRNHIKYILEEVNLKFKEKTSKELTDFLTDKFRKTYPDILKISNYKDTHNDIPCKFSIYKLFNYNGRTYMLEGAVGVCLSILTYDERPLIQIKNKYNDKEFNKFINRISYVYKSVLNSDAKEAKGITKRYSRSNDEKINVLGKFENIDISKPIMMISSYSSMFKEVDKDTLSFIPREDFKQDSLSNDIYVSKVTDKDLLLCFPIDEGEITNLETSEFEAMKRFEKARPKHGS